MELFPLWPILLELTIYFRHFCILDCSLQRATIQSCNMASTGEPVPKTVLKSEKQEVVEDKPDDLQKTVDIVVRTWKLVNADALKHGTVFYKR